MKSTRVALLAVSLVTLGSIAAQAQLNPCNSDQSNGNICYGYDALPNYDTSGGYNSAFGDYTLYSGGNTYDSTAVGYAALYYTTTGSYNTATGANTLFDDTTGNYNTANGYQALYSNTTGSENTAVGSEALSYATTSSGNTAAGANALQSETTGYYNTATGASALYSSTAAYYNTANGYEALYDATGQNNIGVGYRAGWQVATGNNNIEIGYAGSSSDSGAIYIGTPGTQTSFVAAGVDGVSVSGGVPVYINSSGQLGTVNSSIRFKEDVRAMGNASSAIFRLRPVTYRYKKAYADGSRPIEYGLIAEEVAEVYPDLVVKGADGQIQTVQYQKLTPMLLNELQKQHRLLEQMEKTVAQQQEAIQLLKTQETETVQMLGRRLAALEAAQPSGRLEARVTAQ